MAKFPEPPPTLTIPARTTALRQGTLLWRIYFRGGQHPTNWNQFRFFGPTEARFDHHHLPKSVQARGILYSASEPHTCLAEAFQATRVIDRSARDPWLVGFELTREVTALDLMGTWPTQAGASMAIGTGPRPRARRWSRLIYATYSHVEALLYGSSMHANRPAIAFYERCRNALPAAPKFNRALTDASLLSRLNQAATDLGYGLV